MQHGILCILSGGVVFKTGAAKLIATAAAGTAAGRRRQGAQSIPFYRESIADRL